MALIGRWLYDVKRWMYRGGRPGRLAKAMNWMSAVRARAPILRRYLALAPGARPHVPVDRRASLEQFARVAGAFPVFRIVG
jgi:hypothetical protein